MPRVDEIEGQQDAGNERRLRLVVEAAPNAMVMINQAGEIVLVNVQTEQLFGYPRSELSGQSVEMLVPERFRTRHPGLRSAFFKNPGARPMGVGRDLYGLRKDGTEFPVEIGLNPIETDEGLMVLSAIADITDRKAAEQALRESENRLRASAAIIESSDDAIVGTTLDGIVTSWNKAAELTFGYAAAEMIGQSIQRLAVDGQTGDMLEILDRMKQGERLYHSEAIRRHRDGTTLNVSLNVSPIYDTSGRLIGVSRVTRDITAAKARDAELKASQARIDELNLELFHLARLSEMGQLAAMVAHELNQPLTAINNYAEAAAVLTQRGGDLSRLSSILERVSEQANRAADIVRRLRDLGARGDAEKRVEPIAPIIDEAAELALVGTKFRGMSIGIEERSDAAAMVAKVQIQQVLLNLLRNAGEAVAEQEHGKVCVRSETIGDAVQISVIDNGPGLPEEVQSKLFQPFVTTKKTGMGVGLSICHSIIAGHGGRLWVDPNPEGGTIFRIALPVAGR